jgi:hypothetical protein
MTAICGTQAWRRPTGHGREDRQPVSARSNTPASVRGRRKDSLKRCDYVLNVNAARVTRSKGTVCWENAPPTVKLAKGARDAVQHWRRGPDQTAR